MKFHDECPPGHRLSIRAGVLHKLISLALSARINLYRTSRFAVMTVIVVRSIIPLFERSCHRHC